MDPASIILRSLSLGIQMMSLVRKIAQDWQEAETEIDEFHHQATIVKDRLEIWKKETDGTDHVRISAQLQTAKNLFVKHVQELKNKCDDYEGLKGKKLRARVTTFRGEILTRVRLVRNAMDSVLESLDFEDKVSETVFEHTWRKIKYAIDPKYVVPSDLYVKRVREQLELEGEPQVVCLFGEAGKGKSSFARYLASVYQNSSLTSVVKAEDSQDVTPEHPFPGGVLRVRCGSIVLADSNGEANTKLVVEKMSELLKLLGRKAVVETNPEILHDQLSCVLARQKLRILIILDNVYNSDVLHKLLPDDSSARVKYLITSRYPLQTSSEIAGQSLIPMYTFQISEGREILIRHAGFESVPEECEDVIDDILETTSMNPLVLAYLGMTIKGDESDRDSASRWEGLKSDLDALLEIEDPLDEADIQPCVFRERYGRTVRETMTLVFNSLNSKEREKEKKLMLILAMFEGPSVQQDIVQLIFEIYTRKVHPKRWLLRPSRRVLERMGLLEYIEQEIDLDYDKMSCSEKQVVGPVSRLSMYGLYQYFIIKDHRAEIEKILTAISHPTPETEVSIRVDRPIQLCQAGGCDNCLSLAICALYGERTFVAADAKCRLQAKPSTFIEENVQYVRHWMAPILSLMRGFDPEKSTFEPHHDARKIFLTFFQEGKVELNEALKRGKILMTQHAVLITCHIILIAMKNKKHVWDLIQVDLSSFDCLLSFIQSHSEGALKYLAEQILKYLMQKEDILSLLTDMRIVDNLLNLLDDLCRKEIDDLRRLPLLKGIDSLKSLRICSKPSSSRSSVEILSNSHPTPECATLSCVDSSVKV